MEQKYITALGLLVPWPELHQERHSCVMCLYSEAEEQINVVTTVPDFSARFWHLQVDVALGSELC